MRMPEGHSLIPRKTIFGNPDKAAPRVSPDGTQLAFLADLDGVLNVWVGPLDEPAAAKAVTHDTGRGIRDYFWAYTNRHIIYLQDKAGDENWRVYSVDLDTGNIADLTPFDGVQARIEEVSRKFPDEIMVSLNNRVPELHDLYRVNIRTAERELVYENEGLVQFHLDDDYNLRLGLAMRPDGGTDLYMRTNAGWAPFVSVGPDDALTTGAVGFNKAGDVLYMIDSRERDTAALVQVDLTQDKVTVLAENARADVSDYLQHPTERNIEAVGTTYDRKVWQVLDNAIDADLAHLRGVCDGDMEIVSRSLDDRHWIVAYVRDNGPVSYYHYTRGDAPAAMFLFSNRAAFEDLKLARMHPVIIKSRDGLNLVSYLSLPPEHDQDGKPTGPLPMVLLVHGGPWARDEWGYNAEHQWLTNRGYAVLSVNFRGSTGLGKSFTNAANKEWSAKMHDDLVDAVNWAVEQRIADPAKIAIMGGSYGGYATLVGLTFTPDLFTCGIDIVGPSNLVTLLESIPDYWKPMLDLFITRVGDHRDDEGKAFLLRCSPLARVEQIRRPLLIGQGANDPRVKQAEADQIVSAMQQKNIPVTYVLYSDEGHGFARPENSMSFNAVAEAFLAQHLGGQYEPIGDDFTNSTIAVPAGADQIPGLKDAL
ncbi:MAG: S9 family peptidase [Phycisphaerae bacterium]|nr:S9 family peptidase [Phycisphaerae bacterium]